MRVWLVKKVENFTRLFGKEANVTKQCVEELTEYDSVRGREETDKYVRYLIENNEKPTRDFCSLGKSKSTVDDISQIQKTGGGNFESDKERGEHIRLFYSNLYKKRIDRVLEIENLFTEEEWREVRENGRKLGEDVKLSLEGEITEQEL